MNTIIIATVYAAGWIAATMGLEPSSDLNERSLQCSITEYSYPFMPGLDISWLNYCQQVYGDVLLETSLDDYSSIIDDDAFIMHDHLFTQINIASTTTNAAMTHNSTSNDGVVVPSGDEINITTSSADSRHRSSLSSISDMSDYLRLAGIAQSTREHVNIYYENTSVKILPLDWTFDSKINNIIVSDTKRWVFREYICIVIIA